MLILLLVWYPAALEREWCVGAEQAAWDCPDYDDDGYDCVGYRERAGRQGLTYYLV